MNIVLGEENIVEIKDRMTVLELDRFKVEKSDQIVTAYCVLENLNIGDLMQLESYKSLHQNLIKNYRLKNWSYCEQAIEHLYGKWAGQLDSFYDDLLVRIGKLKSVDPGPEWKGIIVR